MQLRFPNKPVSWIASLFRGLKSEAIHEKGLLGKRGCVLFSSHNIYLVCSASTYWALFLAKIDLQTPYIYIIYIIYIIIISII